VLTGDNNKKKDCNPFRNFIAKQVIKSIRFQYLVRYVQPKTVRAIMNNPKIVSYVLRRNGNLKTEHINESQIDKYYKNLPEYDSQETNFNKKVDALTKYLTNFSFNNIESQRKFIVNKIEDRNKAIEKLKALTGLYLMVAYVAVKGLVKANSLYYIAFASFDRDFELFKRKLKDNPNFKSTIGKYDNLFAITEYFLDEDDKVRYVPDPNLSDAENKKALFKFLDTRAGKWHFTKKWNEILRQNIDETKKIQETGGLLVEVRNHAAHLNVLANLEKYIGDFRKNNDKPMQSYFELYHYILQRIMIEPENLKLKAWNIEKIQETILKYNTPSHDLIKCAYISLAYNLPRYKNLTVEALFDEDSESGKDMLANQKQKEIEKKKIR
jgi:hypothetical protein